MTEKKRTTQQNRALHLACRLLADALNDAGFTVQELLRVDVDWTTHSVKDYIFRPFMRAITGKESTTQLAKHMEIDKIWDNLMRELGEKKGIEYIPFPSLADGEQDQDGKTKIRNY